MPAPIERPYQPFSGVSLEDSAALPLGDLTPIDIEQIVSAFSDYLESNPALDRELKVMLSQHQVVHAQPVSGSRLDVVAFRTDITDAVVSAAMVQAPANIVAKEPHDHESNRVGRRDRMPEKSEQGHFVQEMAKRLSPQFDALKMHVDALGTDLVEVKATLTEHGHALSDIGRRISEQYDVTIAHTEMLETEIGSLRQALETQIGSLRQEMKDSSAQTNALLQTIAASLRGRSASME